MFRKLCLICLCSFGSWYMQDVYFVFCACPNEAVEVIHMSDLYSFARIHIHRKEIWFIPRTPLYIYI